MARCRRSGGRDGGVDGAGLPGFGFSDEAVEEGARGGAEVIASLGMPLDTKDEVSGGALGCLPALDRFNDCVLWAPGGDAETVPGDADGLVVAGVDGQAGETFLL